MAALRSRDFQFAIIILSLNFSCCGIEVQSQAMTVMQIHRRIEFETAMEYRICHGFAYGASALRLSLEEVL